MFPCNGKQPATRHGLHDATTDVDRVRSWWEKHPARNIGLACGASGLVVVDVDPKNGGLDTYNSLIRAGWDFPTTRTQITGSSGFHLFYRMPDPPLKNTTGRLHGYPDSTPGVDVRGAGGYVIVAPSTLGLFKSYEWMTTYPVEPSPVPEWFTQPTFREPRTVLPSAKVVVGDGYAEAALRNELNVVRTAPKGTRNHMLNRSVFSVWRFCIDGHLDPDRVTREFIAAGTQAGLTATEVHNTIQSAAQGRLHVV